MITNYYNIHQRLFEYNLFPSKFQAKAARGGFLSQSQEKVSQTEPRSSYLTLLKLSNTCLCVDSTHVCRSMCMVIFITLLQNNVLTNVCVNVD